MNTNLTKAEAKRVLYMLGSFVRRNPDDKLLCDTVAAVVNLATSVIDEYGFTAADMDGSNWSNLFAFLEGKVDHPTGADEIDDTEFEYVPGADGINTPEFEYVPGYWREI